MPKILLEQERSGPNKTIVIGNDDLKQGVKKTLGDYLRDITSKNEFAIKGESNPFSYQTPDGYPTSLTPVEQAGAKDSYFQKIQRQDPNTKILANFSKISNSGFLDTETPFQIKKGRSSDITLQSGDDVFREVDKEKDNAPFVRRVQDVLRLNNRLNTNNPFIPRTGLGENNTSVSEDDSNIGIGIVQKEFGVHYPRKFQNVAMESGLIAENPTLLKIKDLKKIGFMTMLKASGEAYSSSNPTAFEQDLIGRAGTILPGLARIGQKVPISRFSPNKIMEEIDSNFRKPSLDNNLEKGDVFSYGNVNNYLVPFAGLSSISSVVGAGILVLTVGTILRGLATVVKASSPASTIRNMSTLSNNLLRNENQDTSAQRRRNERMGSYLGKTGLIDISTAATNHDYFRCVDRGISIFFGFQGNSVGEIAQSVSIQVAQSNGFYNVIMRNIIRSLTDDVLTAIGPIPQPTNLNTNPGFQKINVGSLPLPIDPIAMIGKINNSQILKFLNVLAGIGDLSLGLDDQGFQQSLNPIGGIAEFSLGLTNNELISTIDAIPETLNNGELNNGILQAKSKLFSRQNALSWGNNTTPSMYWFPNTVLDGAKSYFGSDSNNVSKARTAIKDKVVENSGVEGRIEKELVESLEIKLEADYVPFYFHDLRTNEIISFHAFLGDISDEYSADYEETDAYGRIGKVQTYKNTVRKIGLSFKMVATNEQDFDLMWYKINKLTTMVYPQYSEGRRLTDGTNKFIQPFSQIPTSSPMVRIRLGDLFKTNYNKFALARLFGISSDHFKIGNESTERTTFAQRQQLQQRIEQIRRRMDGEVQGTPRFQTGEIAYLRSNYTPGNQGGMRSVYARFGDSSINSLNPFTNQNTSRVVNNLTNNSGSPQLLLQWDAEVRIVQYLNNSYVVQLANTSNNGSYVVNDENLYPNPNEYERIARNALPNLNESNAVSNNNLPQGIREFFNTETNSIFKSFETTKGKGLAGFIKNISFDMNNSVWDTNRYNARAPMFLGISIQFDPIHDINPGIDNEGFMTSPTYNVGNIMDSLTTANTSDSQNRHKTSFRNARNAFVRRG